ncbi:MAG: L-rhamnose mutarotase [Bacteroidia bacterium]
MKTFYLALDLINDEKSIQEYEDYHQNVWPEVLEKIKESGITSCEIFRVHNRLMMRIETSDSFSFEEKNKIDFASEKVLLWEDLMWKYQQAIPGSKIGEKWQLMEKIFEFKT